jgi:hypothetical protein
MIDSIGNLYGNGKNRIELSINGGYDVATFTPTGSRFYGADTISLASKTILGTDGSGKIIDNSATTLANNTTGNAATATKWQTARNLTIGSSTQAQDGTAALTYSLAAIGAQPAGSYLPVNNPVFTGTLSGPTISASTTTYSPAYTGGTITLSGNVSASTANIGALAGTVVASSGSLSSLSGTNLVLGNGSTIAQSTFQAAGSYQPLENQRLSTTNSPTFAGATIGTGAVTVGSLTAGGIVKANTSGALSIASVGDINSGMGYSVPVTGDGVYTIANGSRLNGIFHIHWEVSNRAEDLVVQCSANQFDQGTITVLSYGSYTNSNSISNVSIYKASGGATMYLTVTLGNRNSGTASIGVTYFGMASGMSFLGSYSGTAISSMTTVPYNSLGTSGGATIGGGLTVFGTGTAISAPNGEITSRGNNVVTSILRSYRASQALTSSYASIVSALAGSTTIPANSLSVGDVLHIHASIPSAAGGGTWNLIQYFNGSSIGAGGPSATTGGMVYDAYATVITTGSSGTMEINQNYLFPSPAMYSTGVFSINTTTTNTFDVDAIVSGSATITYPVVTIEKL